MEWVCCWYMLEYWQCQFVNPSLGIGHSWRRRRDMSNLKGCQNSVQGLIRRRGKRGQTFVHTWRQWRVFNEASIFRTFVQISHAQIYDTWKCETIAYMNSFSLLVLKSLCERWLGQSQEYRFWFPYFGGLPLVPHTYLYNQYFGTTTYIHLQYEFMHM